MLLACLTAVHAKWKLPVIVSTHPRTRKRLEALEGFEGFEGLQFMEPFGFHDYNMLQMEAACVLSDSGTVSEESSILEFPAVTLRDSIERPEALDAGSILMTGLEADEVINAVTVVMGYSKETQAMRSMPSGYEIADASTRAVNFILSTAKRHHQWSGIRR